MAIGRQHPDEVSRTTHQTCRQDSRFRMSVLRGRLRATDLFERRQDHRYRRRPGIACLERLPVPERRGDVPTRHRLAPGARRALPRAACEGLGNHSIAGGHAHGRLARQADSRRPLGRRSTSYPGHRAPGRRHSRQRRELFHQEAFHRAWHHSNRKPGSYLTFRHGPQFGDLLWPRRSEHIPRRSGELRLHRDPRLQYGRMPSGSFSLGHAGS